MINRMLAAALQMNSQPDLDHNMDHCYRLVKEATSRGAQLVGLPENFAFLGDEREKHRLAGPISRAVYESLPDWSRAFGIYLMAGGFPVRAESGKVYNTAMMLDPDGQTIALYNKIHLFDVAISEDESYRESELVEAGKPEVTICDIRQDSSHPGDRPQPGDRSHFFDNPQPGDKSQTGAGSHTNPATDNPPWQIKATHGNQPVTGHGKEGFRVGLSICYDIRFPELYRALAAEGCDIICVPAAFTRPTGEAHWETLLRARAIENSAYVLAPAQTGTHGEKRKTYGHSMIIDPWGRVLADAGTDPGIITAEIDTAKLDDIRKKLPSLTHRVI